MKKLLEKDLGNVLALGLQDLGSAAVAVVRDAAGLPIAWRLFRFGPFSITQHGVTVAGEFTAEHANAIMGHFGKKGNKIPIDSEHTLKKLADKLKVDEDDLIALLGKNRVTMGYGSLALQADGLWIQDVEWIPLAAKAIAEGILRWFSPVLRGLVDGYLRITSVAMTNLPGLDQLDAIAATAEEDIAGASGSRTSTGGNKGAVTPAVQKGASMKGLLALLGAIIGLSETDSAALTAEGAETALLPKLQAFKTDLDKLRTEAGLAGKVRESLALGAETGESAVTGKLAGLLAKAEGHDALKARVDALALEAETDKKAKLIEKGKTEGKLTPDLIAKWADKQDSVALAAFLEHAPVIVTPGLQVDKKDLKDGDAVALTAEDEAVAQNLGISTEKMLEVKKAQQPKK